MIVYSVNNGVGVQLIAKGLLGSHKQRIFSRSRVLGENRSTGKSEQMILFKRLDDRRVHIAELTAVAFVKYDHNVLFIDFVFLVFLDKGRELLNGRDDYTRVFVLKLLFKNCR